MLTPQELQQVRDEINSIDYDLINLDVDSISYQGFSDGYERKQELLKNKILLQQYLKPENQKPFNLKTYALNL